MTATDLATRMAALTPAKRELLMRQLAVRQPVPAKGRAAGERIERRDKSADPPRLSAAQERLWFLCLLAPEAALYNVQSGLLLRGPLDAVAMEQAFRQVIRRHESLRTTIGTRNGEPVQVVSEETSFRLPVVSFERLPARGRERETERLVRLDGAGPFDLEHGPLLRVTLLRRAANEHALLLSVHHLVFDGWSLGVLLREIRAFYGARLAGTPAPRLEPPLQYADFSLWQRRWLAGGHFEAELDFWRRRLDGMPHLLELPTDRPRSARRGYRGSLVRCELPAADVRAFSAERKVTLFVPLLAAFAALLSRYSGQRDLVLGLPSANRRRSELEDMIGFLVNNLLLRFDLTDDPSFDVLVRRAQRLTLEAYEHQDLPFEELVRALNPERSLDRQPMFQVVFAPQNQDFEALSLPGLGLEPLEPRDPAEDFDLTLMPAEEHDRWVVRLRYSTELFDATTARRLVRHYRRLLEVAMTEPGRRVSELVAATPAELHQARAEWNVTGLPELSFVPVHRLVEERSRRVPDTVAVGSGERLVTYGELDLRAGRLARRLRSRGVGPEVRVAIEVERSPELVVSLLAVLKAGGTYVPCDPDYPEERLRYMLGDSRPRVTLRRGDVLDLVDGALAEPVEVSPLTTAYVIYTSGSTGRPKGVALVHQGLLNLVRGFGAYCPLAPGDRAPQVSSLSFDAMVLETWPCLCAGATLLLVAAETASDPARLVEGLVRERITACFLSTPLAERALVESRLSETSLRVMLTGGDRLRRFHRPGLPFELVNLYGPTENTVISTWTTVPRQPAPAGALPAIGRPVPECRAHVLERNLRLVPTGVAGELCLAGESLARGYLGQPARTARSFVPDPFAEQSGGRLYRTGDLVCHLAHGAIRFLGRIDRQVKLRGLRIELGEIEAVLGGSGLLRECAVVTHEQRPGELHLVAYVVPRDRSPGTGPADLPREEELRACLKARLPEYMVPGAFVVLDALPLSANGKVDRAALLRISPERRRPEGPGTFRTPSEELMAGIWAEVLGVDEVGRGEDFFALGGHSLLATQVISRIRESFGVEMPLRGLFEESTLAELARRVDEAGRSRLPAVAPIARDEPPPLSFAQERLWFIDQLAGGDTPEYNVCFAVRLEGVLVLAYLSAAVNEVVRRHEVLRTTFHTVADRPVQVIAPRQELASQVVDLEGLDRGQRQEECRRRGRHEAERPFDLRLGPLLRTLIFRLAPREHEVCFTVHHVAFDGWSTGVFVREVTALYRALSNGDLRSPLPVPTVQYADFAIWQRQEWMREELSRQSTWWRDELRGAPQFLELPTDRPRPPARSHRGEALPVRLPPSLARELKDFALRRRTTLFMTLLAAFQVLLSRYSHQDDLLVGSPIAGRVRAELEPLIGFFVNTLVLRAELRRETTFREFLGQVRETTLGAYAHQDLPFSKLVDELRPPRDRSRSPLFQVMFVLQNAPAEEVELPELSVSFPPVARATTQFDLTLSLAEAESGLSGTIEYPRELFDATTLRRLRDRYGVLLAAATADPERALHLLPLVTAAERQMLLVEWNDSEVSRDVPRGLARLVQAQVERTPDTVAVDFESEHLSYRELERRAGYLSRRLRQMGVGPEVRVGVSAERSLELVVALLGVLEAGGAYVPLDPEYPAERLAFMAAAAHPRVILVGGPASESLPESDLACLDLSAMTWPTRPENGSCAPDIFEDSPAYVIFTSGSTGRPKGCTNTHRGIVNRILWMQEAYRLEGADRVLQKTPFSFDVSIWEFFWPLAAGARLVLARSGGHRDPFYLHRTIAEQRITTLHFVPSMLRAFLESEPRPCPDLRRVIVSGEALTAELRDRFAELLGSELHNLYGPTEAAVDVTFEPCAPAFGGGVPIGRPIANLRIRLLDRSFRPVPIGIAGELTIGGAGLGRGYLAGPGLTAERFVPDPWVGRGGERLYRTGDLAHELPDGRLEFLGRVDHQVKIRGFRVELQEIEAILSRHPSVTSAAVVARGQRLVAYVASSASPAIGELRAVVQRSLPEYMVPSAFVVLEALPLTPSGKVDRSALAAREVGESAEERVFVAPRTPIEEDLVEIWTQLLDAAKVSVHDNFFHIGGHSLLATQLFSKIRRKYRLELPLTSFFEAPTVEDLAERIELSLWADSDSGLGDYSLGDLPPVEDVESFEI